MAKLFELEGNGEEDSLIFGGIYMYEEIDNSGTLIDVFDSTKSVISSEEERYWVMHFIPFGSNQKIDGLEREVLFLGCIDLLRVGEEFENEEGKPTVIRGSTFM